MIDYEVHRCSRRCAATEREFFPGEAIYSVLVAKGKEIERQDYSLSAWKGPPEGALGWWKATVPQPNAKKAALTPGEVLLGYFEELADDAQRADVRYLLALLMIRRKLLRQESTESHADGSETLILTRLDGDTNYHVPVVMPTAERLQAVQTELLQLLQTDSGPAG